MKHNFYKKLFIIGFLIIAPCLPYTLSQHDNLFFHDFLKLNSDEGIISLFFTIGFFLMVIAVILKAYKKG
jgi:hypothetical protein